ncbi:PD-(D/E)XK nuclease family transposase [Butyrivibrio proteoclasticus]|uniref:PD-(D/E)XK nuclease family transposase n=1 Tax=Butyrivibrio proteoclasticus TaxID=43305 RepID=UPI00047AD92C|nr:PD-(D/E)XK nuclease family transposase [Butyrivibrio proteoclasticus]
MTTEETLEQVKRLKPIDDVFFERLMENKAVCQEILRVILDDNKLIVKSVVAQRDIQNLYGRSVRLDALCILGNGAICNIEVQKSDNDDHVKRVRYNASLITANKTPKNSMFADVPNLLMVFISRFDIFNRGRNIYHAHTVITDDGVGYPAIDNGLSEVYVNTAVKDGTALSELMTCFESENVDNAKFPILSKEVQYYKNNKKGVSKMCQIVEEYAQGKADFQKALDVVEHVDNLANNGNMSIQQACKLLGIKIKAYKDAKKLLSSNELLV